MSLYRQAGRTSGRKIAIAAVAALVAGLAAGFALGRASAPEPTLAEAVADVRAKLQPAQDGLELVVTEYGQAVRAGRIVAPTEYDAAQADVTRVADAVRGVRADLRALDPARAAALERAVAELRDAVRGRTDPAMVRRRSDAAATALRAVLGGS